jgi:hypothetical protein
VEGGELMDYKSLDKNVEMQLFHLWGQVGFVINLSQMIEYTIANVVALDEYIRNFDNGDNITITYCGKPWVESLRR